MSRRMSKSLAERIARAATEKHYSLMKKRQKEEAEAVALEVYEHVLGDALKILPKIPKGFLKMSERFEGRNGGQYMSFYLSKAHPLPYTMDDMVTKNIGSELATRYFKQHLAHEQEKKDYESLKTKVQVLCESTRDIKSLRKVWPEGNEFYKDLDFEKQLGTAVYFPTAELNAALGLKSQGNIPEEKKPCPKAKKKP